MASGPGRISFLDNHDMNRFLFVAGNDIERLKMAALCQFTLGAIPVIYYGTEVGMSQEMFDGDVEARRDMPWKQDGWNLDLLSFYQALTRMRHSRPVLCVIIACWQPEKIRSSAGLHLRWRQCFLPTAEWHS
jgi:glycosidase